MGWDHMMELTECSPPKRQRTLARLEQEGDACAPSPLTGACATSPIVAALDVKMGVASMPRRMRSASSWASAYARQLRLVRVVGVFFCCARGCFVVFFVLQRDRGGGTASDAVNLTNHHTNFAPCARRARRRLAARRWCRRRRPLLPRRRRSRACSSSSSSSAAACASS